MITGPEDFTQSGARLSSMTQSTLYKGITAAKGSPEVCRQTAINLAKTQHAVAEIAERQPSQVEVWNSLKQKDFDIKTRAFFWKVMHNTYKCGDYWKYIPNYEHRSRCEVCGTTDSIEHALTECRASGQEEIWCLAESLWNKGGLPWKKPTLGMILGCGLVSFHP
ncbi:hypothetical protein CPB84DRAFT_1672487 [Gymnopilus junonius]|uniref:Reverse transcriptase zinc-binding domain-containing protein n=1 Tax=Gymnopilus junonius TaxID=109634 RepID=A0A9P5NYW2_GYMJU|nr:hypothetical protein CPB84DRAFT_1672487 [Gymnopilus junonius]